MWAWEWVCCEIVGCECGCVSVGVCGEGVKCGEGVDMGVVWVCGRCRAERGL